MRLDTQFLKTTDGIEIFVRDYTPDRFDGGRTLFWVHGLGEHGGRHEHIFRAMADRGWRTVIPDLRGHGKSTGIPTHVMSFDEYLKDIALVWQGLGLKSKTTAILGHSMGGLIAIRAIQTRRLNPSALVISSPLLGLKLHVNPFTVLLGKLLVPFIATARFANGIDPSNMTHDAEFAALRRADPFIVKSVTAGWFFAMRKALAAASHETDQLTVPTLALQGSQDATTDPDALAIWFRKIASTEKDYLLLQDHFHELFFESDWKTTLNWTIDWLDQKISDRQTFPVKEEM